MEDVTANHTQVGQNIPKKKIVSLCFAVEAIREGSKHIVFSSIIFSSSDTTLVSAIGVNFLCSANKKEDEGWLVDELLINIYGKGWLGRQSSGTTACKETVTLLAPMHHLAN